MYRFFDHTGDVGIELSGTRLEEVFASGAEALTDTLTDRSLVDTQDEKAVTLQAPSLEDLLVDWLNELLYRFEVDQWVTAAATLNISRDGVGWTLTGSLHGERFDPARHPARVLVKSATYHGLTVTQTADGWQARIILDI
jgi:protein archease